MVKRTCPNCGAELWSADGCIVWVCECGAEIDLEG
jgi:uncharacterized Zn finger protein (UPF0148 family)